MFYDEKNIRKKQGYELIWQKVCSSRLEANSYSVPPKQADDNFWYL
jgi:hypothetical protein